MMVVKERGDLASRQAARHVARPVGRNLSRIWGRIRTSLVRRHVPVGVGGSCLVGLLLLALASAITLRDKLHLVSLLACHCRDRIVRDLELVQFRSQDGVRVAACGDSVECVSLNDAFKVGTTKMNAACQLVERQVAHLAAKHGDGSLVGISHVNANLADCNGVFRTPSLD